MNPNRDEISKPSSGLSSNFKNETTDSNIDLWITDQSVWTNLFCLIYCYWIVKGGAHGNYK